MRVKVAQENKLSQMTPTCFLLRLRVKIIKFSFDGSVCGTVLATLSQLNSDVMPTQSRDSYFPILAYNGPENKEALQTFLTPVAERINILKEKYSDEVEIYFISDLAGLAKVSDLKEDGCFCLYCKCLKAMVNHYHKLPLPHELKLYWNLNVKLMICILHGKMRLLDNLILAIITKAKIKDGSTYDNFKQKITEQIRSISGCQQFKFRETDKYSKKQKDQCDDIDQEPEDMPFMNVVQVDSIFANLNKIFHDLIESHDLKLLKLFRGIIYGWLTASQYKLELPERYIDITYRSLLKITGQLSLVTFAGKSLGHYSHIVLVHSPHLLQQKSYAEDRKFAIKLMLQSGDKREKEYAEYLIEKENLSKKEIMAIEG